MPDQVFALPEINRVFAERCAQMVARPGDAPTPFASIDTAGPAYLETLPASYVYWETLGYRIPITERMFMGNTASPNLIWNAELFDAWCNNGLENLTDTIFRNVCPYPEARSQVARLSGHIAHSRVLIIGSETFWLELLCCLYGAAEVVTVEYRDIVWQGKRCNNTPLKCITWDRFLQEFPEHQGAYDLILTYSSIEHSGLGRYGDNFLPLGDLYTCLLMSKCLAPHGLCAIAVPVGQDLTHFNAHRIYSELRIRAMEHMSGWKFIGIAGPDEEYLSKHETEPYLKAGWSLPELAKLPLGTYRQPILCFARPDFTAEQFVAGRDASL